MECPHFFLLTIFFANTIKTASNTSIAVHCMSFIIASVILERDLLIRFNTKVLEIFVSLLLTQHFELLEVITTTRLE